MLATASYIPQVTVLFFLTDSRSSQDSRLRLGKWATPAYDTVDPRNAGDMAKTQSSHAFTRGLSDAVGKTATPYGKPIMRKSQGGRKDMLDHVCAIPHGSSRVTSFRHFPGAMSGGGRWLRMPGLVRHLAFRHRRLHPVGGALRCPQLAHYRKELNLSVMTLVVPVCGGGPHPNTSQNGVPVP